MEACLMSLTTRDQWLHWVLELLLGKAAHAWHVPHVWKTSHLRHVEILIQTGNAHVAHSHLWRVATETCKQLVEVLASKQISKIWRLDWLGVETSH
jgi:hypothetical protein